MRPRETVILAAGDFPRKGTLARRILEKAKRVVCCDGAADVFIKTFRKPPLAIVGDFDSATDFALRSDCEKVRIAEQDTNDLEKAIRFCESKGWKNLVILGATGKREDHTIGNVFRAMDAGIEIVTEYGRFIPVEGTVKIKTRRGAGLSVFAPDAKTRLSSDGLAWPIDRVRPENLYCATLNRTTKATVTLTSSRRICVFVAEGAEHEKRV